MNLCGTQIGKCKKNSSPSFFKMIKLRSWKSLKPLDIFCNKWLIVITHKFVENLEKVKSFVTSLTINISKMTGNILQS